MGMPRNLHNTWSLTPEGQFVEKLYLNAGLGIFSHKNPPVGSLKKKVAFPPYWVSGAKCYTLKILSFFNLLLKL
jgi:hypothetical protein